MSEEIGPGTVPPAWGVPPPPAPTQRPFSPPSPPAAPTTSAPWMSVSGNKNSKIIMAAGPVTMTSKPQLPVTDIPAVELDVVRLAWVDVDWCDEPVRTVGKAVDCLNATGPALAVVAGPAGYGKRSVGLRALWEISRSTETERGRPLQLREIRPDWETPGSPDVSVLPDDPSTGYLLDVAAEIASWQNPGNVAGQLVSYAEALRQLGSFLVVIADEHGWPEAASGILARFVARATNRPSPHLIAKRHLEYVHRKPDRVRWLNSASPETESIGQAAHLLTDGSRPADAARLAETLLNLNS